MKGSSSLVNFKQEFARERPVHAEIGRCRNNHACASGHHNNKQGKDHYEADRKEGTVGLS